MNRYPHAPRFGRVVAADIEFESLPAPAWVELDGWTTRGVIPAKDGIPARYLLVCQACGHEGRYQRGRINTLIRKEQQLKCRACANERVSAGQKHSSGRCKVCEDMPWRRRHPVCTGCRKPYDPERITSPDVSLVGGQLAGLAEVMDV